MFGFTQSFVAILLLTLSSIASAEMESVYEKAPYEVHYSTFNSSFIDAKVAEAYGIVRSKSKALLNISVLKKGDDGLMHPVSATVKGDVFDLVIRKQLEFKEIREQHAVYYLATFDIEHKIPVYFTVHAQPDANKPAMKVEFKKMLWVDGKD